MALLFVDVNSLNCVVAAQCRAAKAAFSQTHCVSDPTGHAFRFALCLGKSMLTNIENVAGIARFTCCDSFNKLYAWLPQ